jgi:tRNA 2-thiocytidine biosynthesis protein TtcA
MFCGLENRANRDFLTVQPNDRILVAVSGGKDSFAMLWVLGKLKAALPFSVELFAFHLDQAQPGHDPTPIRDHFEEVGVEYEIEKQDTYSRVVEKTLPGKVYCSLCSRFRRAILYKAATRHGCNKVALGHHREDLIETLMLNILYSGQIKSMPPRLRSDDGKHEIIRPLCYVHEADLIEFAQQQEFPVVPCKLCGSQEKERKFVKDLLADLEKHSPHIKGNLLAALGQVHPTHLLDKRFNPHLGPIDSDGTDEEPSSLLRIIDQPS